MTRFLLLLVALYLVWRVATIFGRIREREYRERQRRFGVTPVVRCHRCGRLVPEETASWHGIWPLRRPACPDGCRSEDSVGGPVA